MDASVSSQARILMDKLTDKFTKLFDDKSEAVVNKMLKANSTASAASLQSSLKKLSGGVTLKTNNISGQLKEILKASVNENVELIKSVGADYLSNVKKQVMRSITTGNGLADLVPALKRYKGITERHAKNMALDQTRKVYNSMNRSRMESANIKQFKWLHSGGGQHPRPDHVAMNGNIYSFDNLPVIVPKTGERGIPGQAINCKCTMTPVFTLGE
jgi:SPP1 gp7 family putative phage head morphogenesis protein